MTEPIEVVAWKAAVESITEMAAERDRYRVALEQFATVVLEPEGEPSDWRGFHRRALEGVRDHALAALEQEAAP